MIHSFRYLTIFLLFLFIIAGCSSVGVTASFNPDKKLRSAEQLFNDNGRPLPAEPLIFEAIEIYGNNNDNVGLAKAYQTYAYFLQAPSLEDFEKNYRKYGFMDKTISFDNRYKKALEYWQKSLELFEQNSKLADTSNIYYNIGRLHYMAFGNQKAACDNYSKSINSHNEHMQKNPNSTVVLYPGFDSFEDYINALRNDIGCN